jgi:hypothetical protein
MIQRSVEDCVAEDFDEKDSDGVEVEMIADYH